MQERKRKRVDCRLALLAGGAIGAVVMAFCSTAKAADEHSVDAIVAALTSPISADAVKKARDFDDRLMAQGQSGGRKVYLVTDNRSRRVNVLVKQLLEAAGQDPSRWVVRVLRADPPVMNAFVAGGKYVYVYASLIDQATSDDELAFVLSHELGHSLLKHEERATKDVSTKIAGLAVLAAALSKKHANELLGFAKAETASFSRGDEEEADAIATAITHRAGFDPLRGADFFTREERQQDKARAAMSKKLLQMRAEVLQEQKNCKQWLAWYHASIFRQTQSNANKVNAICQQAETKRVQYNQTVQRETALEKQQQANSFFATHPKNQNRIAAIAALTDYLDHRRNLQSLAKFQQSYRVMVALKRVNSVLLKPPLERAEAPLVSEASPDTPPAEDLTQKLSQLKRAHDQGLINDEEYSQKRAEILKAY